MIALSAIKKATAPRVSDLVERRSSLSSALSRTLSPKSSARFWQGLGLPSKIRSLRDRLVALAWARSKRLKPPQDMRNFDKAAFNTENLRSKLGIDITNQSRGYFILYAKLRYNWRTLQTLFAEKVLDAGEKKGIGLKAPNFDLLGFFVAGLEDRESGHLYPKFHLIDRGERGH